MSALIRRNPFLNRSMIRNVGQFYGRQREIERIMARVGSPTPQSVSIVGDRRVGKSSLLWYISQEEIYVRSLEAPEHYVFLMIDFQRQQHLDQSGFCKVFGENLEEAVDGRLALGELRDFTGLERAVQELERADLRLVCLCDEFETVTRNPDFGSEFFGFLRSMANTYPIAFVTSSRRDLQSLCHTHEISESPFFNIFSQVHLGPFGGAEARELIADPSSAAGLPLESHSAQIMELSGHLPFFLQVACSAAFECMVESGEDKLQEDCLERRFMEEAASHFRYLWERYEGAERLVCSSLAVGKLPPREHGGTLKELEEEGYVEGDRLFSTAFAAFLREHAVDEIQTAERDQPVAERKPIRERALQIEPLDENFNPFPEIVGRSETIRRIFALMQKAASSDVTVLVTGQTGTGKELVARCIHQHSSRCDAPFVVINCGAIAEHLQESEFFGHKKGAFTDAVDDREGLFEMADGGTIFLDEIGEAAPATQVKLLRVLQEGEVRRVGEGQTRSVDVRLICATNCVLEEEVRLGNFREDLYYRLFVLVLHLPMLSERREDIPLLVTYFMREYGAGISDQTLYLLQNGSWPGNIRELENQINSAIAMAGGEQIRPEHLWDRLQSAVVALSNPEAEGYAELVLKDAREKFEREFILERMRQYGEDMEGAAHSLGISRSRLYDLIRRYDLKAE